MSTTGPQLILGPMRPPFLLLAVACVLLGIATAHYEVGGIAFLHLVLALVGGIAAHVAVNALNEYDDFRSGLDAKTERTPFSGGSGVLPANPEKARYGLVIALTAVAVTVAVGIYFLVVHGWMILPLGLLGLLVVVTYTRWLTHSPLLCLVAPGLGFALMSLGTHFVLTGTYSWTAATASLVPFFLVSDLLLLNQLPDVEADATVGRRHLMIIHGRRLGLKVYGVFLTAAYLSVVAGWAAGVLPVWSLLSLLTILIAVPTYRGSVAHAEDIPGLIPFLGRNVVLTLATPVLLAVGLFMA